MADLCPLYEGSSIMRLNDKKIFLQVAQELKLWILVRRTNPASLQYIGRAGYAPKSIDCKAKTADQHGGEMQYADHSDQAIDAFGPNGEDVTILNQFSVRGWYQERFQGRKSLGGSEKG